MSTIEKLALQGGVDMDNSILMFQNHLLHVRNQHIREMVSDYIHVSGRLENVATVSGIDFINDSKADNLNAVWYSLESMTKPVIWIVNDVEINEKFEKIIPLLRKKVKAVILLNGQNSLSSHFSGYVERVYKAHHIEHAVELAHTVGMRGDAVLFSFVGSKNHNQTGKSFSNAVKNL
jgi:UDP-N-acetylmuramoylalanine--D-glutamate ligase